MYAVMVQISIVSCYGRAAQDGSVVTETWRGE